MNVLADHIQIDKESTWTNRDPTQISAALLQLRGQIETLLCEDYSHLPNCSCKQIQELYGTNLYRCDRPFCQFYSTGFATRREREVHLKVHSRPYLCPQTDCLFAELGFKSSAELARHCKQTHPPQLRYESRMVSAKLNQHFPEKDIQALIEDTVRHNDTDTVLYLLENFKYPSHKYGDLQKLAATHASGNMIKCLLDQAEKINKKSDIKWLVLTAIRNENMAALQYLIITANDGVISWNESLYSSGRETLLTRAFNIGNADIMEILINDGRMEFPSICPENLFCELIQSKRDDTEKVRRLRSMKKYVIWPEAFTNAVYWASLTGSLILVQGCLDCGGSANAINNSSYHQPPSRTALYQCVKKGTNRHAEVVKLLLQNGADINTKVDLSRLVGFAKIEKYFGMSWEDLVIQTQGHMATQITS